MTITDDYAALYHLTSDSTYFVGTHYHRIIEWPSLEGAQGL